MAISSKLLNDGEHVVISTRTHPKALIGPVLALVVLLAIGVVDQVFTEAHPLQLVVWVLVLLGIVWFCVRPLLQWLATTYTITNRRLITRRGVLTRRGHDIPLSRISDVEYEMDLIDRMLGCGTLMISDASTDGEVTLSDIPHVETVQRRLNDLLHRPDAATAGGSVD
ncbi:PH domain-containing protein [Nocardioides sp. BP30]|uniref:PH domain-containing protein n=1 Tax=Nocardioides sp. BP30 TaxID=3036374 RepID=UPI00246878FD|nr:PH domain-containing protein [Nocardioides sp. BP30]WGL51545.1 PH domain-containing protein [Nocardioides sp. BP30]